MRLFFPLVGTISIQYAFWWKKIAFETVLLSIACFIDLPVLQSPQRNQNKKIPKQSA